MAKMRWGKLEWERKARAHEPLADPDMSELTERDRQRRRTGKNKAKRRKLAQSKRRRASVSDLRAATLKAVERVSRQRRTQDPEIIARELGINRAAAARYLAEIKRRG